MSYYLSDGGWWRVNAWGERVRVLDRTDGTDDHQIGRHYHADCSACWVGLQHSRAYHDDSVRRWRAAV